MSNIVWVKWQDAAGKEEYSDKVTNLDDSADISDLRRAFVEQQVLNGSPGTVQVRETKDGEMLKSSTKLTVYFVTPADLAAASGPGKNEDTALFLTLPLQMQPREQPPPKRRRVGDTSKDTEVKQGRTVVLPVERLKILTPDRASENVHYYGRQGMEKLFKELADPQSGKKTNYNIEFIGAPGSGKRNLAWAVAHHIARNKSEKVVWMSRRSRQETWMVYQLEGDSFYDCTDYLATNNLKDMFEKEAFSESTVLIIDGPWSVDADGVAPYAWAGSTHTYGGRIGTRRVIHVSSLGASTQKDTLQSQYDLQVIRIHPWIRQHFIDALRQDESLKKKVCDTLGFDESKSEEEIVDSKFFYSGINARWFFNFPIEDIKEKCKVILERMSPDSTKYGEAHREAVNSAFQKFYLGERSVTLFTCSYLACSVEAKTTQQFLTTYPLIKEWLGNGAPGEIFEADFAIHLQHCHDLADSQKAVMGHKEAQPVDVRLGNDESTNEVVLWPTGRQYCLPSPSSDAAALQTLPEEAVRDKGCRVAMWFIPKSKSQPFLDFFLLIPKADGAWEFRAIQNTTGKTHSADIDELKRVVGGVIHAGFVLDSNLVVCYIVEDVNKLKEVFLPSTLTIPTIEAKSRSSAANTENSEFKIKQLRVKYERTGATPS